MGRLVSHVPNENPDRLGRVMDAKYRTIGIDKESLDGQVKERNDREDALKERDRQYARLAHYFDEQLCSQQVDAEKQRKEANEDLVDFRHTQQGKHTRREWDLYRPDALKIDSPARIGDDDPRCGPSSLQKFTGEDLTAGDRQSAQHTQSKEWWEQQMAENMAMKAAEKNEDMAFADVLKTQEDLQKDAARDEMSTRRTMNCEVLEENKRLAEERKKREAEEREEELRANNAEMDATLGSALMTEDPRAAVSTFPNRVRREYWKGMTEAEKQAIQDILFQQVEEKKSRRQQEAEDETTYARRQLEVNNQLHEMARRVEDFRIERARKEADNLKRQMEEKRQRDKDTNELYANQVAPDYFVQFGTSHR